MLYRHILSLEIKNNNEKLDIKLNILWIILILLLIIMQNSIAKPISYYDEAKNNAENSIMIVNTPLSMRSRYGFLSDNYLNSSCVMYNIDYHILSTCRTTSYSSNGGFKNNERYHNKKPWFNPTLT